MKLKTWEFLGVIFIIAIGTFLYFTGDKYELQYMKLITPKDNSLWEILKLTFYAMGIYALIEYLFIGKGLNNYLFAKTISYIVACFLTLVIFYGYTSFMDQSIFLNLLTILIAVLIAQVFSFTILEFKLYISGFNYISFVVIILTVLVLSSHTYEPLSNDLFEKIIKLKQ
jgi:Family of unknown function (DUF6512)